MIVNVRKAIGALVDSDTEAFNFGEQNRCKSTGLVFFICISVLSVFFAACSDTSKDYPQDYYNFKAKYYEDFDARIRKIEVNWEDRKEFFTIMDTAYIGSEVEYDKEYLFIDVKKDSTNGDSVKIIDSAKVLLHLKNELHLDFSDSALKYYCGPYNANIFIENSLSMNGYVNGQTKFKNAIYELLSIINSNDSFEKINMKYINSTVDLIETFDNKDIESRKKISQFVDNKLNPTAFNAACSKPRQNCNLTKIEAIIDTALAAQNDTDISILISDFIFSPESKDNIVNSLERQQISISGAFNSKEDTHIAVYRLISEFNGIYYDINDAGKNVPSKEREILKNRPYFIWFLGTKPQLNHLNNIFNDSTSSKVYLLDTFKIYASYDDSLKNANFERYSNNNDSGNLFYKLDSLGHTLRSTTLGFKYLMDGVKTGIERNRRK